MSINLKDRIRVDFIEIPKEQRLCDVGTVVAIALRFPDTKFEKTMITIRFDENYVKEEFRFSGISSIILEEGDERMTVLRGEE